MQLPFSPLVQNLSWNKMGNNGGLAIARGCLSDISKLSRCEITHHHGKYWESASWWEDGLTRPFWLVTCPSHTELAITLRSGATTNKTRTIDRQRRHLERARSSLCHPLKPRRACSSVRWWCTFMSAGLFNRLQHGQPVFKGCDPAGVARTPINAMATLSPNLKPGK